MPSTDCYFIESFTEQGLDLDNLFGIFQAEVITNNLYLGLLPIKTKLGLILPNGTSEGTRTSVELQYSKKQGYNIKVLKGYQFNKVENVFDNYVNELSLQKDQLKGSQRQIVKSLLNNLLGGFAINFVKPITQIVKNKERLNYIILYYIIF